MDLEFKSNKNFDLLGNADNILRWLLLVATVFAGFFWEYPFRNYFIGAILSLLFTLRILRHFSEKQLSIFFRMFFYVLIAGIGWFFRPTTPVQLSELSQQYTENWLQGMLFRVEPVYTFLYPKITGKSSSAGFEALFSTMPNVVGNREMALEHHKKALGFQRYQNLQAALEEWEKAASYDPSWSTPFYNISCMYSRQGKSNDAITYLQMTLARDSSQWRINRILNDADFNSIRHLPAYRELMQKYSSYDLSAADVYYSSGNQQWYQRNPLRIQNSYVMLKLYNSSSKIVTNNIQEAALQSLTNLRLNVVSDSARRNALGELAFSQTGLASNNNKLGKVNSASYFYIVKVSDSTTTDGIRLSVKLQSINGEELNSRRAMASDSKEAFSMIESVANSIATR